MPRADVAVIGAGLAGLTCAAELAERGATVFVAAKGMATTHWTHGGLDIAAPSGATSSRHGVAILAAVEGHPYGRLSGEIDDALRRHLARTADQGLDHEGDLGSPLVPVPTAIGALRPAAILPSAQAALREPWGSDGLCLVGFRRYRDAWPDWAARNLTASAWANGPREIHPVTVDLPGMETRNNINAQTVARLFDDPAWRADALAALAAALPDGAWRVGVPAVLGLERHREAHADAERVLGCRVFELPSLPPSVPGMRLYEALRRRIAAAGGRIQVGFDVSEVERSGTRITAVHTEAASRSLRIVADTFVLASGGIAGTGVRALRDGTLDERVFGLPVSAPPRDRWFSDDPLAAHGLEVAGIETDDRLAPAELRNVRVVGSALPGMHYLDQRCGDGVALASAHFVARSLAGERAAAA